jgi:glutamate racemase
MGTRGTVSSGLISNRNQSLFSRYKGAPTKLPHVGASGIENGEHIRGRSRLFRRPSTFQELMQGESTEIDCILLACTHYPLLDSQDSGAVLPSENVKLLGTRRDCSQRAWSIVLTATSRNRKQSSPKIIYSEVLYIRRCPKHSMHMLPAFLGEKIESKKVVVK